MNDNKIIRLIGLIGQIRPIRLIRAIGQIRPIRLIGLLTLALIFIATSCKREPLELYTKGDSEVRIDYDWSKYTGTTPNGLYVMFAKDGNTINMRYPTHDLNGETKEQMEKGTYQMLVMTNTIAEYEGNMRFYNTNDYENIYAVSEYYSITNQDAWDKSMRYMEEPQKIGVALDSFNVTMDNNGHIFYEYDKKGIADTLHQKRELTILPMTTTLTIRVKVKGINYIKDPEHGGVDGYITGMADGFYLTQQWRRSEVGSIKLNHWRMDGYETNASRTTRAGTAQNGWIAIDIETFGLPHGRELIWQRVPQSNFIKLHFTLLDGRTVDFSYNVGQMIRYDGDDGTLEATFSQADVALQLDLEIDAPFLDDDDLPVIPYAQPEGSGQFDAEVEDWGDDENVDVPM